MKIRYVAGKSIIHRLNPLTKLAVLAVFSFATFMFDSIAMQFASLLLLMIIAAMTRSAAPFSVLISKFMLSFIALLFIIQVLFNPGGTVYFSVPLCLINIDVTEMGITIGLVVALRFASIIFASAIFVLTTDPGELAYSLIRAGVPYRFGFMLVTALRFIPVFESEAGTVRQAQLTRGLDIEGGGLGAVFRSAKYTLQPLIVSALGKVDVLAISMEGRAFGCRPHRTFIRTSHFRAVDLAIILLSVGVFLLLLINRFTGFLPLPDIDIYNN
ncbi:energy-coupling factor transporter transmembrane component T family protein [Methanocella arvoryzae]|uniref:ABC-type cobalt import system, permease component n=1 Tax=Methanocella arvoryzae (strain DSM 22066 / NBRC 105507 / MRE50) TaxID=351160 RepID=Q0W8J3_METAR|nr:energy-coupling factor transporter transmembrane component T [Methanocella arvoryzae]CAJ35300.1 putative ABC-type cobalt import system, permease component [Methanocella arvoryzae MRE50]